jgi:lysophospholipase L1-like esterase
MRFLALGDSYTIGEGVAPSERWPVQLARLLLELGLEPLETTIIAQTGWTTADLQAGINAGHPTGDFDLVSLLIGVNNQYRGLSQSAYRQEFISLLQQSVNYAGNRPSRVIVLSIPDWGVTPFAGGRDRTAIAREIDLFNTVNRQESGRLRVHYVDVTEISRQAEGNPSLIAGDGLHPSGKMYAQWADKVLPIARRTLAQPLAADESENRIG